MSSGRYPDPVQQGGSATLNSLVVSGNATVGGGIITRSFLSGSIDLVTPAVHALHPALPGFYGIGIQYRYAWKTAAGTYSTPPTAKMGNNAGHDNVLASGSLQPATASFTTTLLPFAGGSQAVQSGVAASGLGQLIDLATPISLEITSGASGVGLTAICRIITTLSLIEIATF